MKPKTLVEIASFPPPMGGWAQRIEIVADAWRARGHHCVLMNIGASRNLENSRYLNIRGPLDFLFQVYRAARKGDVLHTHTNAKGVKGNLLALAAQLICRWRGSRCALTFHAGPRQDYFPKGKHSIKDRLLTLTFKTADLIICNSTAVKTQIVNSYGIPGKKVHCIQAFCAGYMNIELQSLPLHVQQFAEHHDPLLVSYVSYSHPDFAVDTMMGAIHRLRDKYPAIGLIIVSSPQAAEQYASLTEPLGLDNHVLFAGNLPRPEFLSILKMARLCLRTPMGDGVASSVLEALSLGTPVIASDNGTRPAGCVLYRHDDMNDMAVKIDYALTNYQEVVAAIVQPDVVDTDVAEVELLASLVAS